MVSGQSHFFLEESISHNQKCTSNSSLCLGSFSFGTNSVQQHPRGPRAWESYSPGEPLLMHSPCRSDTDVCASTSPTPHCNHAEKDCRKLPPVALSSTSLLPWPTSLGMKTNVCTPDTHSQHGATAVVYAAEAGRAEGTVLFWHLNNNYFFWTLAFDIDVLCSQTKSWWHYGTWNCTALLLG